MEVNDVVESIQTAIDAHRTDILKTVLDTVKKGWGLNEFVQTLNQPFERGTFLHIVTQNNQADMVRLLLTYGADPTLPDNQGKTPVSLADSDHTKAAYADALFASIAQNNMNTTQKLLIAGLDLDVRDNMENKNSLLHWAVSFSNKEAVSFLIEQGAQIDCTNSKGLTPLHEAVLAGNCDLVQLLIQLGANTNYPAQGNNDFRGKTSLELAKPESAVRTLLARHQMSNGQPNQHLKLELNGHHSTFQVNNHPQLCRAPSPGTDSVFSTEEMAASLPFIRVPVRPVITDARLHWLWPPPKQMQQLFGPPFQLNQPWTISFTGCTLPLHQILDIWDVHKPQLTSLGINPTICNGPDVSSCRVTCCVKDRLFTGGESYRLTINGSRISMVCADANGLHYALATLEQLITLCQDDGRIPALHIDDSPSLRMRAVLLDITVNGRVPLLDALFSMVDAWSSIKINQLHLYVRFECSPTALTSQWPWPYTKTELLSLDRYCLDRGVELVPALEIHGDSSAFDPQSFQSVLASTRSCFPSTSYIHAGPHLTSVLTDQLRSSHLGLMESTASAYGLTWLLCANSLREKNLCQSGSVDPGVILTEYGFQADYNFHDMSQTAWQQSSSICFCSGTASWSCLSSYPDAAAANILHSVQAAVDRGSLGSIAATWTDAVALGSLHFAWPGWILHAGLSWNPSVHWDFIQNSLGDLVSLWIFNESISDASPSLGTAMVEMGRLETWLLRYSRGEIDSQSLIEATSIPPSLPPRDGSMHYQLLVDPDNVCVDNLTMECVVRALRHAKKWHNILAEMCPPSSSTRLSFTKTAVSQAVLTADFILLAGRIARGILTTGCNPNSNMGIHAINLGVANLTPTLRTDVANRLLSLTERFKQLWTQQYQVPSSGLNDVLTALTGTTKRLLAHPGNPDI